MVRLTRLKINKFRLIQSGTELHFGSGFNVLMGKNAAGKTTLLDLIARILDDSLCEYAGEPDGIDIEYRIEGADEGVSTEEVYGIDVKVSLSPANLESTPHAIGRRHLWNNAHLATTQWSVTLHRAHAPAGFAESTNRVLADNDIKQATYNLISGGPSTEYRSGVHSLLTWASMSFGQGAIGRLDEALDTYRTMKVSSLEVDARGQIGSGMSFSFLQDSTFPSQLIDLALMRIANDSDGDWTIPFTDLGFRMTNLLDHLGFEYGRLQLELAERRPQERSVTYKFSGIAVLLGDKEVGKLLVRSDELSFGQRRLIGFYWYLYALQDDRPPVIDELANGLHHEWIGACVDELSAGQSFMATQNPLLLDYLPLAAGQTTFIRCAASRSLMTWRNLSNDENAILRQSQEIGIEHTSEVLRSEGLW